MIAALLLFSLLAVEDPYSDDCATPVDMGASQHLEYQPAPGTNATTGTEGQDSAACNNGGDMTITGDIWITWTPVVPASSQFGFCRLSAILTASEDMRLAVYKGSGCPSAPAIACGDDTSGSTYPIVEWQPDGGTYTIQIGTTAGAAENEDLWIIADTNPGQLPTGQFDWQVASVSTISGTTIRQFLIRPLPATSSSRIQSVSVFLGEAVAVSGTFDVEIWDDPNDDGDISDRILIRTVQGTKLSASVPTLVDLGTPCVVTGSYAIAIKATNVAGQGLIAYGCSPPGQTTPPDWYRIEIDGHLYSLSEAVSHGFTNICGTPTNTRLIIREVVEESFFSSYPLVFCNGNTISCPCANQGGPMRGCASSIDRKGAFLGRYGPGWYFATPNLDKQWLVVDNVANSMCWLLQSTIGQTVGLAFTDGVRCIGPDVKRIYSKQASNGVCDFGWPNSGESIGVDGGITFPIAPNAVQTYYYQVMYRDPLPTYCTPESDWNFSNAIGINWYPLE